MNAPTLIVGLGGTGSKIALKVADMVSEEERQRIGFAVFDTDVNELRIIKQNNPFVYTIQTSTKLSVGEYLDIDTHARDTWFPVNAILNSKTLTEGAGQVRAVSRMAFETAVRAGKMEQLHKAIEDLYKLEGEEYQQALRVIIVSSLAGGTGSGLILPVALYIKNYLATRFRQSANISRGFFLLPEVFYGVIPGQAERNNLKSNAYATLRELDAFMMKGDSTLPDRYKDSVKIEFPCASSNEYEDYNVRPYDFCFLFDAQNSDGKKLNSFNQYLDHAANCIYAQSIGPMNKRSNSSEDNTIRKLCAERGRNRYAGAGTSMLIYPVEDIKKYMSLTWAKECVSEQWLMFDKTYKALLLQNAEMKRKGIHVADIKEGTNYIASVESFAANKDPFAMEIVDSCASYEENGVTIQSYKWDDYMAALGRQVSDAGNSSGTMELNAEKENTENAIENIQVGSSDEAWSTYASAYKSLLTYKGLIGRYTNEVSRTVAYSIFKAGGDDVTSKKEKYQLETYLRDETGNFIHPCAVRYFLYKVQAALSSEYLNVKKRVSDQENFFANFESDNFDDGETDKKETVNDLARTKKVTFIDKIKRQYSADQEELISAFRDYLDNINAYRVDAVYKAVLEEGLAYVKSLAEAFESFFKSFDSKIVAMNKEIKILENKRQNAKGTAARYVCASKECLQAMSAKMPYTGGSIEIDSGLAEAIYKRVRNYAQLSVKSENEDYFSAIFDIDILNYFSGKLMDSYATDVDMDIIAAIEKEAEYEEKIYDDSRVAEYVKSVISSAKVLAAPFIEKPMGEEKDPINSCAYNDKLSPKDDSPKARLIGELLADFGGEADADIPKNKILFYKSFYGLRANDLSKFAPPSKGETYDRNAGEYFKAYYELVSKIHPVPSKSKVITPHIDRWWHNVTKMPDLDDENQERQLNHIYAAFFWGFVGGYVNLFDVGASNKAYRLIGNLLGKEEGAKELTVSNGTPCDQFYEVLDAMAIFPELVDTIIKKTNDTIGKEVDAGKTVKDNILYRDIDAFIVREADDKAVGNTVNRSVFEFPLLLKKSMTSEIYDESKAIRILEVVIAELERFIKAFCSEKEYANVVGEVFEAQFDKFLKNIAAEEKAGKSVYKDYLFAEICENIASSLEDIGLKDEPDRIREKFAPLTR